MINHVERRAMLKMLTLAAGSSVMLPTITKAAGLSSNEDPKPVYVAPGGGEHHTISFGEVTFKFDKSQTVGNLGSNEGVINPGLMAAPPHFHKTFDEICIVTEGTIHILVGDDVVEVPAGGWHLRPRNMVHTFWNSGSVPAKYIELFVPGGFEEFIKGLAKLNEAHASSQAIVELAKNYDITLRFDLLQGIMDKYKVHM